MSSKDIIWRESNLVWREAKEDMVVIIIMAADGRHFCGGGLAGRGLAGRGG